MKAIFTSLLAISLGVATLKAQILPAVRAVDWTRAGLLSGRPTFNTTIDLGAAGLVGDGSTPNDVAWQAVIAPLGTTPTILQFPTGVFRFNNPITLPSNVILRGMTADSTKLLFNLGGTGDCIRALGSQSTSDTTYLTANLSKGAMAASVTNASRYPIGAYLRLIQNDSSEMFSNWAYKTLGQIVRVDSVVNNEIYFSSPLRRAYDLSRRPYFTRLNMKENVGIECLSIERLDATAGQTSNILLELAANCWVLGIESNNCNNSHINLTSCSNIEVRHNYLHHAFGYGGGGKAYGLIMQSTTGEVLAENNIFRHLRHSVLLQSGANGNVIGYNYSADPYWNESFFPTNSAGDLVLHGNFPYTNLFEGNIVQNIVIDNSHAANGEHNTFFRNRAELYGIFFSDATSPNQNFVANDVPNTSNGGYTLQGSGHFEYANRYRGATRPTGTDATFLADDSYYRSSAPSFLPSSYFASIGLPNAENEGGNAAADRDRFVERLANSCGTASRPRINFAATAPIQVMEDAGVVLIPVKIDNVNFDPTSIEISYIAASTTAVENVDFTGLSLSAPLAYTWASMDNATAFLSLQITDDQLTENMETIRLVLRNADNGAIIGADSSIFIQILDNDAVGISQNMAAQTLIFPNPTSQNIFIQSQQPWAFVRIIDLQGRTLIALPRADDAPLNFSIDISTLPDGLYWFQLDGQQQQHGQMIRIAK